MERINNILDASKKYKSIILDYNEIYVTCNISCNRNLYQNWRTL